MCYSFMSVGNLLGGGGIKCISCQNWGTYLTEGLEFDRGNE